jgi:hypothetical protein
MAETQSYQNHTQYFPLVHFVLFPLFFLNLIWQIVRMIQEPSWDRGELILLAVGFVGLTLAARTQALRAQDRVIRLLLPKELAEKAETLKTGQLIALRFASDDELSELVQKALNGEFKDNKEIKLAVNNWRGDYLRV